MVLERLVQRLEELEELDAVESGDAVMSPILVGDRDDEHADESHACLPMRTAR